jgi:hypothetical protein
MLWMCLYWPLRFPDLDRMIVVDALQGDQPPLSLFRCSPTSSVLPLPIRSDNGAGGSQRRVTWDPVTPGHSALLGLLQFFSPLFAPFLRRVTLAFPRRASGSLEGSSYVDNAREATSVTTTRFRGPVGSVRGNIPCEPRMGKLAFRSSPSIISVFDRQPQRRTLSAHRPRRCAPPSRTQSASLRFLSLPTVTRIARTPCC